MSKYIVAFLIAFSIFNVSQAKQKRYNAAVWITNPISLYTKIGGGIEIRYHQCGWIAGGTSYMGIYTGKQFRFEFNKYIKTYKKNESFWYVKICGGDATYDPTKLSLLNDNSKTTIGPTNYIGGGGGWGRRINVNHFFLMFNLGLKYVAFAPDFPDESSQRFRLFYATGPGSIVDCNLRLGLQF